LTHNLLCVEVELCYKSFYLLGSGIHTRVSRDSGSPTNLFYLFFFKSFGIVFVVDASDTNRLEESKKILHETEMQPRVAGKPLLM